MKEILRETLVSMRAAVVMLVLCCGLYPLCVFGLGQVVFPRQANGSLVDRSGNPATRDTAVGSQLLGQTFSGASYFHPRPSAAGAGYDAANSSGTNLGPLSDKLLSGAKDNPETKDVDESFVGIKELVAAYRRENGLGDDVLVPGDAVTRSGSGLDPHITPENASLQVRRVAEARRVPEAEVRAILLRSTEGPDLQIFGEPRVNVLMLNLALDRETPQRP